MSGQPKIRRRTWARDLNALFAASRAKPFEWGAHDCFTFAGEVAGVLTGVNPVRPMLGTYSDYPSGLRAARASLGVVGLIGFGDKFYARVHPAFAHRGDWALVRTHGQGWALAIVDGARLRDLHANIIPRSEARMCWRIQ